MWKSVLLAVAVGLSACVSTQHPSDAEVIIRGSNPYSDGTSGLPSEIDRIYGADLQPTTVNYVTDIGVDPRLTPLAYNRVLECIRDPRTTGNRVITYIVRLVPTDKPANIERDDGGNPLEIYVSGLLTWLDDFEADLITGGILCPE